MYDLIIIGAGPAGLTAALYALRAGKKVLVLEEKAYGGQIINAQKIKNYPGIIEISGKDWAMTLFQQVKNFGGETKLEKVVSLKVEDDEKIITTDMDEKYRTKTVIISTGTGYRKLDLPKEKELAGKGISYCATCDGNFYQDKDVAVVGGGNTALMDAIYLSGIAKKVYLIHRRDEFRGEKVYVDEVRKKENVEILLDTIVTEINGIDNLESLSTKTGNQTTEIKVDGLFVAVGNQPQNQIFQGVIELDDLGYIKTDDGIHTSINGIYVAGDAREKDLRQLTTAVSDGAIAATVAVQEMDNS
ncbi:thioredoxin-disulfide reductase [Candidatus Saccharibacteria bacterium]|nr:thioredoxin-disulfide reductase [Candidatus Saccharibacteria bacterium]